MDLLNHKNIAIDVIISNFLFLILILTWMMEKVINKFNTFNSR